MKDAPTRLYYSISEVSQTTGIKAHVLRYWETQFSMLRPRKSRGGIRKYRPKDLALIENIRHLLYDRGLTIAGARRKLREDRRDQTGATDTSSPPAMPARPRKPSSPTIVSDTDPRVHAENGENLEAKVLVRDQNQQEFKLDARAGEDSGLAEIRRELDQLHAMLLKPIGSATEGLRRN